MPRPDRLPIIVALNNVRSLQNVGAIFRSCAAVRIEKILLGGFTPVPPRYEISKTALGGDKHIPWEQHNDLRAALLEYRKQGYHLAALEITDDAKDIYQVKMPFPLVLVVGHESQGVEPDLIELCDQTYALPMAKPGIVSLNVSMATAIALFELQRQLCYDN